MACPVPTARLDSLWERFRKQMTDPRDPHGVRHKLASVLALIALAVAAGCKGPHAIAEFAQSLNHAQRGRLRCRPRKGRLSVAETPSWLKCGPCFEFDGVSHEKISTGKRHATGTAVRRVRTPSRGEADHRLTVPQAA
jgi:hypothetical protein